MSLNIFARSARALAKNARFGVQSASMSQDLKAVIGKREIVGYGFNGMPVYDDRPDFPMPAIRWKEPSADINVSLINLF